jgi:hypothetical protein
MPRVADRHAKNSLDLRNNLKQPKNQSGVERSVD